MSSKLHRPSTPPGGAPLDLVVELIHDRGALLQDRNNDRVPKRPRDDAGGVILELPDTEDEMGDEEQEEEEEEDVEEQGDEESEVDEGEGFGAAAAAAAAAQSAGPAWKRQRIVIDVE